MAANADISFLDHLAPNVAVQFLDRVAASSTREAYRFPRGDTWESVTWQQTGDQVVSGWPRGCCRWASSPSSGSGSPSGTRYEWILADLAIMCAAGATTTVYPSTNSEDTAYILSDSESRVVFAEDDAQLAKLAEHKAELPAPDEGRHLRRQDRRRLGDRSRGPRPCSGDAYLAEHPGLHRGDRQGHRRPTSSPP